MAKRRKEKDEEEEKPFKIPKFDEEAFYKREKRNIRATIISFLFGILMALVCFGFWALMGKNDLRWPLVLLVAIANAAFLRVIFMRLNIDLTDFGRKNWFGSYAIYFVTWMIVFIVLVNPPFYDDENPRIEVSILPKMQEFGGNVIIVAKITDNSGIKKADISFSLDDISIPSDNFEYIDNIFRYIHKGLKNLTEEETHNFKISVKDSSGRTAQYEDTFAYSNDTIYLALPEEGSTLKAASDIKFGVKTNVWRVYYTVNDGNEINASKQQDREDFYITSPEYKGWLIGNNITLKVTAVVAYNFENHFLKDKNNNLILDKNGMPIAYWFFNYINDTSSYVFDVADESSIGLNDELVQAPALKARAVSAPGFETILFLISIVGIVLIFKYKKKNRSKKK
ncbi:hypothetical protein AYK24_06105 [Thermoplasmatales archaeon SG8-52-4]|nr:MAG: hypothetical protein AYK24_06105 [Thermoplasmatales archaeon SG8-52-4]